MVIDFGLSTVLFALLVTCIALFWLWLRAESKYRMLKK